MKTAILVLTLGFLVCLGIQAEENHVRSPLDYGLSVQFNRTGSVDTLRLGLFGQGEFWMYGAPIGARMHYGTLATFTDSNLRQLYGFDWIAAGVQLGAWIFRTPTNNGERVYPFGPVFGVPLLLETVIFHPHFLWTPLPFTHLGTGWDLDFFVWKQKAVVWNPYLSLAFQDFVPYKGTTGPFLEGRIQYTLAASTGPLAAAVDKRWGYGVEAGWRF